MTLAAARQGRCWPDATVTRNYWRESDPVFNRHFSRQWTEPQRRRRRQKTISHEVREKPPPRPPDKERPAPVVRTSSRPLLKGIYKTSTSNHSPQVDKAKAS